MNKNRDRIKGCIFSASVLIFAFIISMLFQNIFDVHEHITTIFVFAVFIISMFTKGYVYGLISALIATLAVNFAFTFPFFAFSFALPVNIISAAIMVIVALLTGTLTTKLKENEAVKAESEMERMRANLMRAVSHDLRTPLTTIYGAGCTLLENGSEMTEAQKTKMITGIKENSAWLIRMVENLLSVTRIDSGKVKIIKTPFVLEELIDSVLVKFLKTWPDSNINVDIPEDILMIPMDGILIEQVLINILENSVIHAKGMTRIDLRVDTEDNKVFFSVSDDGCGIDPEYITHIFDGGYIPADVEADSRRKNAGIGLSVCATIIKAHGGTITAENLPKGGCRFTFCLDLEENRYVQQ